MRGQYINPIIASGVRALPAFFLLLIISTLLRIDLIRKPPLFYLYTLLSALTSFIVGDAFFLAGLKKAPVGVVYPSSYTFSLVATFFSWIFLGENITVTIILSALLMLAGITYIYRGKGEDNTLQGVLYGLGASFFWGLSVIFTTLALQFSNPIGVNTIRLGFLTLAYAPILLLSSRQNSSLLSSKRDILILITGGLLGVGLGPIAFFIAITLEGASKAAIAVSSTPVLTVVMGNIVLKEQLTKGILVGAFLVAIGMIILSIG